MEMRFDPPVLELFVKVIIGRKGVVHTETLFNRSSPDQTGASSPPPTTPAATSPTAASTAPQHLNGAGISAGGDSSARTGRGAHIGRRTLPITASSREDLIGRDGTRRRRRITFQGLKSAEVSQRFLHRHLTVKRIGKYRL